MSIIAGEILSNKKQVSRTKGSQ